MEHGGVLKKKTCLAWVYFHVRLISVIGQFSVLHRNQTCNRPRFEYLQKWNFTHFKKQCTRVLASIALTEPLHVVKSNYVPLVGIFVSLDWATGDIIVDMMRYLQNVISGAKWLMVCWGKMVLRGKMAQFPLIPKGISLCPNALVRFNPRPFHLRKFHWRKWLNGSRKRKLTHCGRKANISIWTESSLVWIMICHLWSVTSLY